MEGTGEVTVNVCLQNFNGDVYTYLAYLLHDGIDKASIGILRTDAMYLLEKIIRCRKIIFLLVI